MWTTAFVLFLSVETELFETVLMHIQNVFRDWLLRRSFLCPSVWVRSLSIVCAFAFEIRTRKSVRKVADNGVCSAI